MNALILSNLTLSDFQNEAILNTIKSIEGDINGLCFVVDKETDDNIKRIERIIKEIKTHSFVINIKRNASEKHIIKNGVRFLNTLNSFDHIFYSNDLNQIYFFKNLIQRNFPHSTHEILSSEQLFSSRNINYSNIYHLESIKAKLTA